VTLFHQSANFSNSTLTINSLTAQETFPIGILLKRNAFSAVMEICNGDYGLHVSKLVESVGNGRSNEWRSAKTFYLDKNKEMINSQENVPMRLYSFETEFKHTPHYAAGFWKQFCVLMKRNAIRLLRDKVTLLIMHIMNFV